MATARAWMVLLCVSSLLSVEKVTAGYGSIHAPLTCLCADRSLRTLDSSPRVRELGCSLFDHCLSCTNNEHQPCEVCPVNRYGPRCEFECNCGMQSCDDGVYGDGECHCYSEEDYTSGGRCQLIGAQKSYLKDQHSSRLPPPIIDQVPGEIFISWQHMLSPSDPISGYEVEYKFAGEGSSAYTRWTQASIYNSANQTFHYLGEGVYRNGMFKFRVNYYSRDGRMVGSSTSPVKVPATPGEPSDLEITSVQGNTISLRWNEPVQKDDVQVGRDIIGYVVQYYSVRDGHWVTYADAEFDDHVITVGHLVHAHFYRFRVAARNKLGIGKWSAEAATLLPSLLNMLECYTQPDGSDYRGTTARSLLNRECQKWTDASARVNGLTPENLPGHGLGHHNFCRNPSNRTAPWCFTTDPDVPWNECKVDPPSDSCHTICAPGLRLSDQGTCVHDDASLIYQRVPLTNGEVCTCALQRSSNGEYIKPQSFIGWTKACAHAIGRREEFLLDNIYNMNADVCFEECIKSPECDAFTYSTNGYNVFKNETDIRLCTLFSHMNKALKIEKSDSWTKYLSQSIPDDDYIISWGCWPAKDQRNPNEQWKEVDLDNNLVFRDSAYKNYTINLNVAAVEGDIESLYISLIIIGSLNVTTPIDLVVAAGDTSAIVTNRNIGFVTAVKITGQIGIEISPSRVHNFHGNPYCI